MVLEFRESVLWRNVSERLALWQRCHKLFQHEDDFPPRLAASFFLDLVANLTGSSAREQVFLLCFAVERLKLAVTTAAHQSEYHGQHPRSVGFGGSRRSSLSSAAESLVTRDRADHHPTEIPYILQTFRNDTCTTTMSLG